MSHSVFIYITRSTLTCLESRLYLDVMKYFLICHLHANLLLVAVVTSRSWQVLAADAGLRLSFPGHVSLLLVPAGSGAAAGPEQPSSGFPSEDLTQPAFDLSLHHDWFIVRWPLAVSHCTCKYVNTLNKIQGCCQAVMLALQTTSKWKVSWVFYLDFLIVIVSCYCQYCHE